MTLIYRSQVTDRHCYGYYDFSEDFFEDDDSQSIDKDEIAVIKSVGEKMLAARELCKLTIVQAAKLLDVDSAFLKAFEDGVNVSSVPLKLIYRAADRYDVSTDFLFGFLGEEWERCPETRVEREINHWFHKANVDMFSEWAAEQIRQQNRQEVLSKTVLELLKAVTGINEALHRFRALNQEFDDMRGGDNLLNRVENAAQKARQAELELKRCRIVPVNEEGLVNG